MTNPTHAVYELGGDSQKAANTILAALMKWEQSSNPSDWQGKDLVTIRALSQQHHENFLRALQDKAPHLPQALGLAEQAIQIRGSINTLPRAYTESPACYRAPTKTGKYYLYCPIDYQGKHFVPKDSILLSDEAATKLGRGLWGGGWLDPITVFLSTTAGTTLPADFDPAVHHIVKRPHLGDDPAKPYRFFKADGETRALLEDQVRAQEQYSKAVTQLFKAIDGLKEKLFQAGAVLGTPDAKSFYLNYGLGSDAKNRPQLEISARREGTGEPFTLVDNRWFIASFKTQTSQYFVPSPNTQEGRALQGFFDAIPANPNSEGLHPSLFSTDNVQPIDKIDGMFGSLSKPLIRRFPEGTYLAYRDHADGSGTFVPPGARLVSQAEFVWLDADDNDRNLGIRLPSKPLNLTPLPKPQP